MVRRCNYSFCSVLLTGRSAHTEDTMDVDQVEPRLPVMDVDDPHVSSSADSPPPSVTRRLKRTRSPGGSPRNPIDLTSAHQVCVDGKMYEIIDLSQDEVWLHTRNHCRFPTPKFEQMDIPERTLFHCTTKEARVTGQPRLLYDVFGNTISYTPSFHVRCNFS